ncbi:AidA/PixA family protein [Nitrospirillum sp. BR 11163]|uniref:AidA/PixA family protein n=1 Tax=Nitrospirillum sp. BR 11163 TaxID=3104323 RepID=UPI002AFF3542|nr:AidA/PixA family protein [Nitrospirillum sp. BR 11163]MEA1676227.1 AidA/PixA family protein [Nitrospirillum sp. BR 11163]
MSTIDIDVVIDTQAVKALTLNSGNSSINPLPITHNYAYMITQPNYAISGQASGDLSIRAQEDDIVRWWTISLYADTRVYAVIYNITKINNNDPTILADFVYSTHVQTVPVPNPGDPVHYTMKNEDVSYVQADVEATGTEFYGVSFYLVQINPDGSNSVIGYYNWDPKITVNI